MLGRGRGRGFHLNSPDEGVRTPLRRPARTNEDTLTKHLNQLQLSEVIREEVLDVVSLVKTLSSSEEELKEVVAKIYKYGLQSRHHANIAAELCHDLCDFQVNKVNFRSVLLQKLQSDFLERENIIEDSNIFISRVLLLCEIFDKIKIHNNPIECLGMAVIEYFDMLLDGDKKEIRVVSEQLMKIGKDLECCQQEKLHILFLRIRREITSNSLDTNSRTLLLAALEQFLNNWEPLPLEVKTVYEDITKLNLFK